MSNVTKTDKANNANLTEACSNYPSRKWYSEKDPPGLYSLQLLQDQEEMDDSERSENKHEEKEKHTKILKADCRLKDIKDTTFEDHASDEDNYVFRCHIFSKIRRAVVIFIKY